MYRVTFIEIMSQLFALHIYACTGCLKKHSHLKAEVLRIQKVVLEVKIDPVLIADIIKLKHGIFF